MKKKCLKTDVNLKRKKLPSDTREQQLYRITDETYECSVVERYLMNSNWILGTERKEIRFETNERIFYLFFILILIVAIQTEIDAV